MKYESILRRIEDEKKDEVISAKLYRYSGLVQAIDYFSQKLVFDQIIEAAFDFINELLLVERSAIFVLDNDIYVPKKYRGFTEKLESITETIELKNLATFYGNILYEKDKITKFFGEALVNSMEINAIVPLIIEGQLYGFIIIKSKNIGEDDYIISEALMRLINNSLENFNRYEKLAKVNSELDEKIFNLFAINQSSKVMLSELRITELYNMSVDVFAELTRSRVTGFVLFDERCDNYTLKCFKDVYYKTKEAIIRLNHIESCAIDPNKVIINLENPCDKEYFNSIFEGANISANEQLEQLDTKYIVLILTNTQIIGFVTLSETVTNNGYSEGVFELIESLAASTYTAISNAKLFTVVNDQKNLIQKKLEKIVSLNNLTKNISSSVRTDTLLEIATKTMEISFNVKKGAFCLYNKETDEFTFSNTINLEQYKNQTVVPNQKWRRIFEGDCVYSLGQSSVAQFFGDKLADDIGEVQGVLIIPVYIDMMEIELLGTIIIFKYEELELDNEENLLILDTIAGNIAPVLNNLLIIQMQQRFMLPNFIELFKNDLKEEVKAASDFNINLTVIQIKDEKDYLFKGNSAIDVLKDNFKKVYPFSYNNIFIIENDCNNNIEERINSLIKIDSSKIKKMVLGKDFKNFADFFELYR